MDNKEIITNNWYYITHETEGMDVGYGVIVKYRDWTDDGKNGMRISVSMVFVPNSRLAAHGKTENGNTKCIIRPGR